MYIKDRKREGEGLHCTLNSSSSRMLRCTFSPTIVWAYRFSNVAQWVEQRNINPLVTGSTPVVDRIWCPIPKSGNSDYPNILHPMIRLADTILTSFIRLIEFRITNPSILSFFPFFIYNPTIYNRAKPLPTKRHFTT